MKKKDLFRILDANINRAREGLRVCEDIFRFLINNKNLTLFFKKSRHQIDNILREEPFLKKELLKYRNARYDVGKCLVLKKERRDIIDLFFANIQRVEEALRVMEEISKMFNQKMEEEFRRLRFQTYCLESRAFKVISRYAKERDI